MEDITTNITNRTTYKNKNITYTNADTNTTEYGYVNNKGILKRYGTLADYNATKNVNGCGSGNPVALTAPFSSLKLETGTRMTSGQSCGYEDTYVKYAYPAEYNSGSSPAWLTNARAGTLTSDQTTELNTVKTQMTKVGKAGYIDMDTVFHSITPTFKSTYGSEITSYITGVTDNMNSCSPNTVNVTYGSKIILLSNDSTPYFFKTNSTNNLVKHLTTYTELYILPTSSLKTIGSNVMYNDIVYLSLYDSITTCMSDCKVGGVNFSNEFSFGSTLYKSPIQLTNPIPTDSDSTTPIKLTNTFNIETIVNFNRMKDGDVLTAYSNGLQSVPDDDGNVATLTYRDGSIRVTLKGVTAIINNEGRVGVSGGSVTFTNGKLVIKDNTGVAKQSFPSTTLLGEAPYTLYLYSNGVVCILGENNIVRWRSSTTLTKIESEQVGSSVYGGVVSDTLKFSTTSTNSSTFKFTNSTYLKSTSCNIDVLKATCTADQACAGVLYSPSASTWMKIKNDSTNVVGNYTTTSSDTANTKVHLRDMEANVSDSSCPDNSTISNALGYSYINGYGTPGTEITNDGTDQCRIATVDLTNYIAANDAMKNDLKKYNKINLTSKLDGWSSYYSTLLDNTSRYEDVANLFNDNDSDRKTRDQQIKDTEVIKSQEKTIAFIWGIVSVSMLLIILFRPRLNTA